MVTLFEFALHGSIVYQLLGQISLAANQCFSALGEVNGSDDTAWHWSHSALLGLRQIEERLRYCNNGCYDDTRDRQSYQHYEQ